MSQLEKLQMRQRQTEIETKIVASCTGLMALMWVLVWIAG